MTVPPLSAPCWARLASGKAVMFKTEHLGMQLLLKRLERSTASESIKIQEVHSFFSKWQNVLAKEIASLPLI